VNQTEIARLSAFLRQWTRTHPLWYQRTAEDVAAELAADAGFEAVKLAGWMQTPDRALITQIVESVLPYPYNYGADVLADAIRIAARQRTERQRGLTLIGGLGLAALVVFLLGRS
jgi:peptidoglycan/xylan/chitin deacetylase (PgdA/CDA1 family)